MSRVDALHISIHEITAASLVLFAIAMMFNHLTSLPLSLSLSLSFQNWIRVRNKVRARTRIIDNQQADCFCNSCLNSTSCSETISMGFGKTPRLNKFLAAKISNHAICNNCRLKTKYSDQDAYWLPLCLVGCQVNSPWRKGKSPATIEGLTPTPYILWQQQLVKASLPPLQHKPLGHVTKYLHSYRYHAIRVPLKQSHLFNGFPKTWKSPIWTYFSPCETAVEAKGPQC